MQSRRAGAASSRPARRPLPLAAPGAPPSRDGETFGRNARRIGALAADQLAFHESETQAAVRQLASTMLTGRAAANHDDVEGTRAPAPG
jgi:hypothetical protein